MSFEDNEKGPPGSWLKEFQGISNFMGIGADLAILLRKNAEENEREYAEIELQMKMRKQASQIANSAPVVPLVNIEELPDEYSDNEDDFSLPITIAQEISNIALVEESSATAPIVEVGDESAQQSSLTSFTTSPPVTTEMSDNDEKVDEIKKSTRRTSADANPARFSAATENGSSSSRKKCENPSCDQPTAFKYCANKLCKRYGKTLKQELYRSLDYEKSPKRRKKIVKSKK